MQGGAGALGELSESIPRPPPPPLPRAEALQPTTRPLPALHSIPTAGRGPWEAGGWCEVQQVERSGSHLGP